MQTYCLHLQVTPEQKFRYVTVGKRRWFHCFSHARIERTYKFTPVVSYQTISADINLRQLNGHFLQELEQVLGKKILPIQNATLYAFKGSNSSVELAAKRRSTWFYPLPCSSIYNYRQASYVQLSRECTRSVLALLTFFDTCNTLYVAAAC